MKKLNFMLALLIFALSANAQEKNKPDTIRVGNMIIIKKRNPKTLNVESGNETKKHKSRISTNWLVVDLGISNFENNTDFGLANAGPYLQPNGNPFTKRDFDLRDGKSINVNIWLFMQRLDLIKKNVGLKYGLGVELNNYRFKKSSLLSFRESGTAYPGGPLLNDPFVFRDSVAGFSKNKLALDYLTVPLMINFQTTPHAGKPRFNIAFGVSAGYLYSQRNKQVSNERGKERNRGDYDLNKFKVSYVGELGLGFVKLYGSYSPNSVFKSDTHLKFNPFTVGFRLGY